MLSLDNLCELENEDLNDLVNRLSLNEIKAMLIAAVCRIKDNDKKLQYKNRLVKEKFDTTSEMMPPKTNSVLNYEGENKKEYKKRGRKLGDKNTYTKLAQRIINGEGVDGCIDGIPYEVVDLDYDDKCPICNNELVQIGEDVMAKVVYIPGNYKLVIYKKKKMVCKNGCDEIYMPIVNDPLEKSNLSTSFISKFIKDKYQYGVPAYRQLDELKNNNIKIDYNQISHHMMKVGLQLRSLAERIRLHAFYDNPIISIDETTYKLLNPDIKDDGSKRKSNYIFGIVSNKVISYTFTGSREVNWLIELFEKTNYKGCACTDDYSGYSFLNKKTGVLHQLCLCHARRRMFYAYLAAPEEIRDTDSCMARKGLLLFKKIFDMEKEVKGKEADYIKEYRNSTKYLDNVEALKKFCDEVIPVQGTYLDDAIKYLKTNWDHLWTYLEDGDIPVSNMKAELSMKKVALVRKNSLFFKNSLSAKINCYLMTIVQTAIKNGVDVYRYLNYVIHHIKTSNIDSLLPWSENLYSLGEDYEI